MVSDRKAPRKETHTHVQTETHASHANPSTNTRTHTRISAWARERERENSGLTCQTWVQSPLKLSLERYVGGWRSTASGQKQQRIARCIARSIAQRHTYVCVCRSAFRDGRHVVATVMTAPGGDVKHGPRENSERVFSGRSGYIGHQICRRTSWQFGRKADGERSAGRRLRKRAGRSRPGNRVGFSLDRRQLFHVFFFSGRVNTRESNYVGL